VTQHVRVNSTDVQLQNSCMADFLNTPAFIWAGKEKNAYNLTDGGQKKRINKRICNRVSIIRWCLLGKKIEVLKF
jgi:hypothetical protein